MNSGCICCSLVGDFGEALKKVMDQFHPDRILIEPSGVGKLSDVIRAVQGVAEQVPAMSHGRGRDGTHSPLRGRGDGGAHAPHDRGGVRRRRGRPPLPPHGAWLHFDYVPEEHQVRTGPADYTGRLCVIGSKLDEAGLKALFEV